jgi:hypothetical protein
VDPWLYQSGGVAAVEGPAQKLTYLQGLWEQAVL